MINYGIYSINETKLLGVLKGMLIAFNGSHKTVQVVVDSGVVVRSLLDGIPINPPYIHIIRRCKSLIIRQRVRGYHAVDWLAYYGVQIEENLMMLIAVPKDLQTIL